MYRLRNNNNNNSNHHDAPQQKLGARATGDRKTRTRGRERLGRHTNWSRRAIFGFKPLGCSEFDPGEMAKGKKSKPIESLCSPTPSSKFDVISDGNYTFRIVLVPPESGIKLAFLTWRYVTLGLASRHSLEESKTQFLCALIKWIQKLRKRLARYKLDDGHEPPIETVKLN